MSRLITVEQAIQSFDPEELRQFREWFAEYDSEVWDRQIEADAASGKLQELAERALKDHAEGRSTPL